MHLTYSLCTHAHKRLYVYNYFKGTNNLPLGIYTDCTVRLWRAKL